MKLIYLHQYFVFPTGSGGTRSYDLASSFIKEGLDIEIITTSSFLDNRTFSKKWSIIEEDGLRIHVLRLKYSNELSYMRRVIAFLQFLWYASFKLLSLKADVVLATSTPLTIGIPALVKKWKHKTPFIFEVRDVWPEAVIAIGAIRNKTIQKILYRLEKFIYDKASAIVPLSDDMKNSIINRYPALESKPIVVIENISEINRFQNGYNKNANFLLESIGFIPRFTILYAGTFGRVNGIYYVIELAKRTLSLDPTIVFVLIGSGSEKENIIKLAKDSDVFKKNVFILEPVSKKMLPQIYYEANMGSSFVAPIKELWHNSANKFFDTLAAGKPVLINHGGWQKEIIESRNLGHVLPAKLDNLGDVEQLVEYTKNDPVVREQGLNALKCAHEKYSLTVAVEKYLFVFNKVLTQNEQIKAN